MPLGVGSTTQQKVIDKVGQQIKPDANVGYPMYGYNYPQQYLKEMKVSINLFQIKKKTMILFSRVSRNSVMFACLNDCY